MSAPSIPPIEVAGDSHESKSRACQCFVKSNCCSTTNDTDEQTQCLHTSTTDAKVCCVATKCCVIQ